jgi:hypothetical protein
MTDADEDAPDWTDKLADGIAARWRWLVVAVLVVFVLNNVAGLVAGALALFAFANRVAGRVLSARKVAQQIQRFVDEPED